MTVESKRAGCSLRGFTKGFSNRDAGFSKFELETLIDKTIAVSKDKRMPTTGWDKLLAVANQGFNAPQQFTDKWLKAAQSNIELADDVKVFGRSMQGG